MTCEHAIVSVPFHINGRFGFPAIARLHHVARWRGTCPHSPRTCQYGPTLSQFNHDTCQQTKGRISTKGNAGPTPSGPLTPDICGERIKSQHDTDWWSCQFPKVVFYPEYLLASQWFLYTICLFSHQTFSLGLSSQQLAWGIDCITNQERNRKRKRKSQRNVHPNFWIGPTIPFNAVLEWCWALTKTRKWVCRQIVKDNLIVKKRESMIGNQTFFPRGLIETMKF